MYPNRIKIASNGLNAGTRVTDGDTGADLTVTSIQWELDAREGTSKALISVVASPAELESEARIVYDLSRYAPHARTRLQYRVAYWLLKAGLRLLETD